MLALKKIAVTGVLASGKSTVCRILESSCGAYVVSADAIVHRLLSPNTLVGQKIERQFGTLDRKQIAKEVFSHPEKLKKLESLLHPEVKKELEKEYNQVKDQKKYPLFIAEIPLLYETEMENLFDIVINVTAPDALCKSRCSFEDYSWRRERQQDIKPANYTLDNSGTLDELKIKTLNLLPKLL